MYVKTAFLNGNIDADVYMEQPEGFIDTNILKKFVNYEKVFTVANSQPDVGTKQVILF